MDTNYVFTQKPATAEYRTAGDEQADTAAVMRQRDVAAEGARIPEEFAEAAACSDAPRDDAAGRCRLAAHQQISGPVAAPSAELMPASPASVRDSTSTRAAEGRAAVVPTIQVAFIG